MRRFTIACAVSAVFIGLAAGPAMACGGLIGRNGSVNLLLTTTLTCYHDGAEHYLPTPDTPPVLDFYANRSPIFLAARFDADAARAKGVALGDGTPVHITIPTSNPWVPLRILGVGLQPGERVAADVFLLTDQKPALLPDDNAPGLTVARQQPASDLLLNDLRTDKGGSWVPASSWLTYLKVDAAPSDLSYDLA